eukprot:scaffold120711_cov32-Tisochrysis_lutea.AAC.2
MHGGERHESASCFLTRADRPCGPPRTTPRMCASRGLHKIVPIKELCTEMRLRDLVAAYLILVYYFQPLVVVHGELALPDLCSPTLVRLCNGV